jgi:hypothetical protein
VEAAWYGLLALGILLPTVLLLGLYFRARAGGAPRPAAPGPSDGARASEHAATHHAIWLPVAQELGLEARTEPTGRATALRLAGRRRDVPVAITVHIPWALPAGIWEALATPGTTRPPGGARPADLTELRVEIEVPASTPLPDGLRVGTAAPGRGYGSRDAVQVGDPALDARLHARADDRAAAQALLSDARLRTALARLVRTEQRFEWSGSGVRMTLHPDRVPRFRPVQVRELADACAGLVLAAAARHAAPWQGLGGALGLPWRGDRLQGAVQGVRVEVDAGFDRGVALVDVGGPLKALRIGTADPGGPGERIKMPTEALAAGLAGRTRDKFLAQRVLRDGPTAAALLRLLQGTPGARLMDGHIELPIAAEPAAAGAVRDAVALSRRLRKVAR